MKKIIFLFAVFWLFLFSSSTYANDNFSLITNSDNWDYIGWWKNWDFSKNADSIQNINASKKTLTFNIENFDLGIMNFSFGSPNDLVKGLYYPAKRFPFRWSFNGIDISGNGKWCNEILWWFYVHEYEVDTSWKLKKAAIDFVQYCEKSTKWLYWSFRYNSSVPWWCTKTDCDDVKEILWIENSKNKNDAEEDKDEDNNTYSDKDVDDDLASKIFKIYTYKYDSIIDSYTLIQYWSAVLVWENLLITNAHVVSDLKWWTALEYEVCQTISTKETAECFSAAKLLRYDSKNDLALLEIKNIPTKFTSKVKFWSKEIKIWSKVDILWYPANGWNTITLTQGTIAWFQNWLYKTDANLDEWNSGWWAFDKDGNFVWIPSFVINWQTTLWYIIPIEKINDFMKWKSWIRKTKAISPKFEKYIKNIYSISKRWTIDNWSFSSSNFNKIWFTLIGAIEKKDSNFFSYDFEDSDWNFIFIRTVVFSKNIDIKKYVDSNIKSIKEYWDKVKVTTKQIGNIKWSIISYEFEDFIWYLYSQTNPDWNTFLEYEFIVDKSSKKILNNGISFLEDIKLKSFNKTPKQVNIPWIKLSTKMNISIFKQIWIEWLDIFLILKDKNFTINISSQSLLSKISQNELKDIANYTKTILLDAGYDATVEKLNNIYIIRTQNVAENFYWISAIWFVSSNWNNILLNISADIKSRNQEKDAIEIFKKILQ